MGRCGGPAASGRDINYLVKPPALSWTCHKGYSRDGNTEAYCRERVDDVPCLLNDHMNSLDTRKERKIPCLMLLYAPERFKDPKLFAKKAKECGDDRVRLLMTLNSKFKYFQLHRLPSYVINQLTKPATALLTPEDMLPVLWNEFTRAMKENPDLKFSHNYFSPEDTSFLIQPRRIVVVSGLELAFTKLLTDRVQNLMSSGMWTFWLALAKDHKSGSKLEKVQVPDFESLTLRHDSVYLLFLITSSLLCLSTFNFLWSMLWVRMKMQFQRRSSRKRCWERGKT